MKKQQVDLTKTKKGQIFQKKYLHFPNIPYSYRKNSKYKILLDDINDMRQGIIKMEFTARTNLLNKTRTTKRMKFYHKAMDVYEEIMSLGGDVLEEEHKLVEFYALHVKCYNYFSAIRLKINEVDKATGKRMRSRDQIYEVVYITDDVCRIKTRTGGRQFYFIFDRVHISHIQLDPNVNSITRDNDGNILNMQSRLYIHGSIDKVVDQHGGRIVVRAMYNPLPGMDLHHINKNAYDFRARNIIEVDEDTHMRLHGKNGANADEMEAMHKFIIWEYDKIKDYERMTIERMLAAYAEHKAKAKDLRVV